MKEHYLCIILVNTERNKADPPYDPNFNRDMSCNLNVVLMLAVFPLEMSQVILISPLGMSFSPNNHQINCPDTSSKVFSEVNKKTQE